MAMFIAFMIGTMVGAFVGVTVMCLLQINRNSTPVEREESYNE